MRHDFRRYYSVAYEEVCIEEALDLKRTLPRGSLYVSAIHPEHSWSEEREAIADMQDTLLRFLYGEGARVMRPVDIIAQRNAARKATATRKIIESTEWVSA